MPAPLRWELYPIPKGPRERQRYGGSYFEQSDWWTKPPETGHTGEVAFMAKEVLLLRSVWENFRGLWLWSWLLHWGLYLYLLATLLAIGEAVLPVAGSFAQSSSRRDVRLSAGLFAGIGWAALVCWSCAACIRACGAYTTRSSIFNVLLLGAIFATGMLSFGGGAVVWTA